MYEKNIYPQKCTYTDIIYICTNRDMYDSSVYDQNNSRHADVWLGDERSLEAVWPVLFFAFSQLDMNKHIDIPNIENI